MDTKTPMYDYVMARLRERPATQRRIAAESGVPFSTLAKIAQGLIKAPSVHHVQALHDYFRTTAQTAGIPPNNNKEEVGNALFVGGRNGR